MSMSKKDFIALADALRPVLNKEHATVDGVITYGPAPVVDALCSFMRGQNPRFNEGRWRDYLAGECGPSGGRVKKTKADIAMERLAKEDEAARNSAERAPKTGQACPHRSPIERDNCPSCEGTGQRIDFAAIRAARGK